MDGSRIRRVLLLLQAGQVLDEIDEFLFLKGEVETGGHEGGFHFFPGLDFGFGVSLAEASGHAEGDVVVGFGMDDAGGGGAVFELENPAFVIEADSGRGINNGGVEFGFGEFVSDFRQGGTIIDAGVFRDVTGDAEFLVGDFAFGRIALAFGEFGDLDGGGGGGGGVSRIEIFLGKFLLLCIADFGESLGGVLFQVCILRFLDELFQ